MSGFLIRVVGYVQYGVHWIKYKIKRKIPRWKMLNETYVECWTGEVNAGYKVTATRSAMIDLLQLGAEELSRQEAGLIMTS